MTRRRVVYYAHDSGTGHLRHARNVSTHLDFDVTVISGASEGPLTDELKYVPLPSDIVEGYTPPQDGPFHYMPTGSTVRERFRSIQRTLDQVQPDVVIVDVSSEVAAFAKLAGYPTIVRRMHGDRSDRAHRAMYDLADGIIAYYPNVFEDEGFKSEWGPKTTFAGMLELPIATDDVANATGKHVVVLTSLGGDGVDMGAIDVEAKNTPDWTWSVVGRSSGHVTAANVKQLGIVADPAELLASADVIISSGGHNAIRSAVNSGRPLIVLPEVRMYDEQLMFAIAIAKNSDAAVINSWDQDWPLLLSTALDQDSQRLRNALLVDESFFQRQLTTAIEVALNS